MKKLSKKQQIINQNLEFFDVFVAAIRKQVELGYPIPDMKILIQPNPNRKNLL